MQCRLAITSFDKLPKNGVRVVVFLTYVNFNPKPTLVGVCVVAKQMLLT